MALFGSSRRHTTHHHTSHHHTGTAGRRWGRPSRDRQAAGYKAAMNNPNTTSHGRKHAKHELEAMGRGREAHTSFSTRLRHWLHLGGRKSNRRYNNRREGDHRGYY